MPDSTAPGKNPPNRLIHEKSPYLLQHAYNPVAWFPWGDEAFRCATEEQRPVFLSIGYATCHWCHVMARESFENPAIARLLNRSFIAIKVDREERPDIDSVYMAACQRMTGQGGWPLTIIMTPDRKPFFAGTYFPPVSRAGMPGLSGILEQVARLWSDRQGALAASADEITRDLAGAMAVPPGGNADRSLLASAYRGLATAFDPVNGGFFMPPKFPVPSRLLLLLRCWKRTGTGHALRMVTDTLEAIRCGGIHDHLGGGFHRYSTDARWLVPHFEKMLYDQALLLTAYSEAFRATGNGQFRKTAGSIVMYVLRDLRDPQGAFMSAEDADSPGGEGAYYLWTREELDDVLGPEDGALAARYFHVRPEGNFPPTEAGYGKNILYQTRLQEESRGDERMDWIRNALLAERMKRPRPQRDAKILADGNGLMIAALAQASRAFDDRAYDRTAKTAMRFILDRMRMPDGGLYHRWIDGEAAVPGFASDYAGIIRALIELYETQDDPAWLREAIALDQYLSRHFTNSGGDGMYSTPDTESDLLIRQEEIVDGVIPSSSGAILRNLVLLGHLAGDPAYESRAFRLAGHCAGTVRRSPAACGEYLCGLDHLLGPASDVVITGGREDPVAAAMVRAVCDPFLPSVTLQRRMPKPESEALDTLAPFTKGMEMEDGKPAAYVCTGHTCLAPVRTPDALREALGEKRTV